MQVQGCHPGATAGRRMRPCCPASSRLLSLKPVTPHPCAAGKPTPGCALGLSVHTPGPISKLPGRGCSVVTNAGASAVPHTYAPPKASSVVLEVLGGKQIKLETGEIGRQANGAVMATCGQTVIYTTACCAPAPSGDGSFVPFTVNYAERFSAAGKTSGGYIKRDGRPKDAEVLVSRLVDRPLRPMFGKGWGNETQVLQWVLSYDSVHPPEPIAITAAGAALLISDIPLSKAVAGVRVGLVPGEGLVVNPTVAQMQASVLDLVMAGTQHAVLMIEGFCEFLPEEQMMEAVGLGAAAISSLCGQMEAWAREVGKPKRREGAAPIPQELQQRLMGLVGGQLREAYRSPVSKESRSAAVGAAKARALEALGLGPAAQQQQGADAAAACPYTPLQISMAFKAVESAVMRSLVLDEGVRADGRGVADIRPITSRCGLLPRTHGSALFTRGETQSICVTTLGSASDALKQDTLRSADKNGGEDGDEPAGRFYLHYHFPPSCVGEVGRTGAPGRRELGHGELAQRALAPIVPPPSSFPYTVRVESTITESNGSSSMASVCGGCLAMMDAGVPILRPVAGIAMGLILDKEGQAKAPESREGAGASEPAAAPRFVVLSDILGSEDSLGDMDFKVAGDHDAITAFQMDIKVEGITLDIIRQALRQAKSGRQHILAQMARADPPPAHEISQFAPRLVRMQIDPNKKGAVIGSGGRTIKLVLEATGASGVDIDEQGNVEVCAPSKDAAQKAVEYIELLASDPKPGTIFRQRAVQGLAAFGCFVELCPGRQGLVHISELADSAVPDVASVVKVGQLLDVMVLSCDNGKVALSVRAVKAADRGEAFQPKEPRRPPADGAGLAGVAGMGGAPRGGRGGRGGGPMRRP